MGKKREDQSTEIGNQYAGYQIYDQHYEKIGKLDDLFVDDSDRPEYVGVKIGFLASTITLIPMDIIRMNDERQLIQVASDKDIIKDAPSFGDDEEITPEIEDRVYAHFGVERGGSSDVRGGYGAYYGESPGSGGYGDKDYAGTGGSPDVEVEYGERQASSEFRERRERGEERQEHGDTHGAYRSNTDQSATDEVYGARASKINRADEKRSEREREESGEVGPGMKMGDTESGEFRGHASEEEGLRQPGSDLEDEDELRVKRSEEELRAGVREREAGSVRVRKRVRTDRERISVPTRHEEVSVERVPVEGEASEAEIGDEEIRVPVIEEEVVVEKRPVVKEELRIRKDVVEDEEVIEADVRKEEVEIEDDTERGGGRREE